jgi:hypothetical protein
MAGRNGKPLGRPPQKAAGVRPSSRATSKWVSTKRDQLLAMNAKFCARLEAAFAAGGESRESAAQAYAIPSRNLVELIAFPSLLR